MLNQAPPLAGLYEELRSALLAAARLHRAIAQHPEVVLRAYHVEEAILCECSVQRAAVRAAWAGVRP